jgi:hypothetical protein
LVGTCRAHLFGSPSRTRPTARPQSGIAGAEAPNPGGAWQNVSNSR